MSGLLLIRHAETDMAGGFCGHSDPPVNTRGKQQIRGLIVRLEGEAVDAVYSSDLRRAVGTAAPIAEMFGAPAAERAGLREIYFGDWEGLTWAEIEQRDPTYARRWIEAFPRLPAPGGESFAEFETRVVEEMRLLLVLAEEKTIAVVTHRGVMRVMLRALHGCSDQEVWERTSSYCCWFACNGADETLKAAALTGDRL